MDRVTGDTPEGRQQVILQEPLGRMGKPEEIVAAVLWLCSDAACFVVGHANGRRRRPNGVLMFVANRDAVAINVTGVKITPGGAAAFIEDATKYSMSGRR